MMQKEISRVFFWKIILSTWERAESVHIAMILVPSWAPWAKKDVNSFATPQFRPLDDSKTCEALSPSPDSLRFSTQGPYFYFLILLHPLQTVLATEETPNPTPLSPRLIISDVCDDNYRTGHTSRRWPNSTIKEYRIDDNKSRIWMFKWPCAIG